MSRGGGGEQGWRQCGGGVFPGPRQSRLLIDRGVQIDSADTHSFSFQQSREFSFSV